LDARYSWAVIYDSHTQIIGIAHFFEGSQYFHNCWTRYILRRIQRKPMRNAQDRIAKLGIIGLAGIAILGWVRQPEVHTQSQPGARAVFQAPQDISPPKTVTRPVPAFPQPDDRPAATTEPSSRRDGRTETPPMRNQSVVTAPAAQHPVFETVRAENSRHEVPTPDAQAERTRSGESQRSREPQDNDTASQSSPAAEAAEPPSQARPAQPSPDLAANRAPQPIVQDTKPSGTRSVAIIGGAAAAGAAIGAIAGHGKGAAIGAAAGAASGYVYDRMSRRNSPNLSNNPNLPNSPSDQDRADTPPSSRPLMGARRIGTPYFN
jgi:hypothetical protein